MDKGTEASMNLRGAESKRFLEDEDVLGSAKRGKVTDEDTYLTDDKLLKIAMAIGAGWEILALFLVKQVELDHINEENILPELRRHKMLRKWRQDKGEEATLKNLNAAMNKATGVTFDREKLQALGFSFTREEIKTTVSRGTACQYDSLRNDFLKDLIEMYVDEYNTLQVSPLQADEDANIFDLYVKPHMVIVDRKTKTEVKTVMSIADLFNNYQNKYQQIYLTGVAGSGKTSFAKWLCIVWSYIKSKKTGIVRDKENEQMLKNKIKDEDRAVLESFDFFFYIPLRDVGASNRVDDMIFDQVVQELSWRSKYEMVFVEKVLNQEKCLVVLEGLDEWCGTSGSPKMPFRPLCKCIVTTRHWKMNDTTVRISKVPTQVELIGIDSESQKELVKNVERIDGEINFNDGKNGTFERFIKKKKLKELAEIPVILIQLAFIWLADKDIGDTLCAIYCRIVDATLTHGEVKISNTNKVWPQKRLEPSDRQIELGDNESCKTYRQCLFGIGKLAYETLFSVRKESSLTIKLDTVQRILSDDQLSWSLHIGFLMSKKARDNKRRRDTITYSFIHKTFQEFLCAFYLGHLQLSECVSIIRSFKSIESILEMGMVLVFLCGLDSSFLVSLSRELCPVVANDDIAIDYRKRIRGWFDKKHLQVRYLEDYQSLIVSCVKASGKDMRIYIQDIFFNSTALETWEGLESLIVFNEGTVKSINLKDIDKEQFIKCMLLFEDKKPVYLEKLQVYSEVEPEVLNTVLSVCTKTLKCLSICSFKLLSSGLSDFDTIPLLDINLRSILSTNVLESLTLESIELSHSQLDDLIKFISKQKQLEEVRLYSINCIKHAVPEKGPCTGFQLNLSKHISLRSFELGSVPVSQIQINTDNLEECFIGKCSSQGVVPSLIESLAGAKAMRRFTCSSFTSSADVESCLKAVSDMSNLEQLIIKRIDLRDADLILCIKKLAKLEVLWLYRSDISYSLLTKIKDEVETRTYQQGIRVIVNSCRVQEQEKFEEMKDEIRSNSKAFMVFEDWNNGPEAPEVYKFSFEVCRQE